MARILVVDDHEVIRRGIRSLLARDSVEVCGEAANGKQALEKVLELKPDPVILDVSMPVMDGIEAAREIRRLAPRTKIVFFTIHDSAVIKKIVQETGADTFALKSDAATDLVVAVKRLLQPVGLCETGSQARLTRGGHHDRANFCADQTMSPTACHCSPLPDKLDSWYRIAVSGKYL